MLVILRGNAAADEGDAIRERIESCGARTRATWADGRLVLTCYGGDPAALRRARIEELPGVERVVAPARPYTLAARSGAEGTVVRAGSAEGVAVGGGDFAIIAGPCSVEGLDMLRATAVGVCAAGASMLRGGAYKPRTSPYAFHGLGEEALEMLAQVRAETGLPVVTEVTDARQIEGMLAYVDVFQVGARNMQNFTLLAEVGMLRRPVLLKRGASATIEELLLAAEHVLARGNDQVILCERGIRARETMTRNTLDIAAVPLLKQETHLPVIVDPSHAAGRSDLVLPLSLAALAAGADGIIVEVHPSPENALSDGDQSLTLEQFAEMMRALAPVAAALGRTLPPPVRITVERVA